MYFDCQFFYFFVYLHYITIYSLVNRAGGSVHIVTLDFSPGLWTCQTVFSDNAVVTTSFVH